MPKTIACAIAMWLIANSAFAQAVLGGLSAVVPLAAIGSSVGNGADTSEDQLQLYTLPASVLKNVGDRVRITATGTFAASTDAKTVRVRWGGAAGTVMVTPAGSAAGQTRWSANVTVIKTGANTQAFGSGGIVINATTGGSNSGTAGALDTNAIDIVVTGQNATSSSANSITCQILAVELIRAPAS